MNSLRAPALHQRMICVREGQMTEKCQGFFNCMLLGLATVAMPAAVAAQNRPPTWVGRPPLVEQLQPTEVNSPLAINAIYGFVRGVPDARVPFLGGGTSNPTIHLEGLGRPGAKVCVEVTRAQGGYRATFDTVVPKGKGLAKLNLDSSPEVRSFLDAANSVSAELAIRASVAVKGKCPGSAPMLVGSWSGNQTEPLYLAVGGFGLGLPSIRVDGAPEARCDTVSRLLKRDALGANVYGGYCPVEFPAPVCKPRTPVRVLWKEGGVVSADVALILQRDCNAK